MNKNLATNSVVDGYHFPFGLSDNETYASTQPLVRRILFWIKVGLGYRSAERRLRESVKRGTCYYGPFKGEFGHFTAHTLPFLMYLHKRGVKIIYCGMELHKPFMVDEAGNSIVAEFVPLRDFFKEVSPTTNATQPPPDVASAISAFKSRAELSGHPFWNIDDNFYYWFIHRNWLLTGKTYVYNINRYYGPVKTKSCCIFPRSKGAAWSKNNGERWDYTKVIDLLTPWFDKVYICGHPAQVAELQIDNPKVELAVSADNAVMLEKVSQSQLIVTQHSGINNVGEFVNTQVLIIYKGGNRVEDIGSMNNTLRFRRSLGNKLPLAFAFSEEQITDYVKTLTENG